MTERIRRLAEIARKAELSGEDWYALSRPGLIAGTIQYDHNNFIFAPENPDFSERFVEEYKDFLSEEKKLYMPGGNHYVADFEYILHHGISGCRKKIAAKRESNGGSEFLQRMTNLCDWVDARSERLAAECENAAKYTETADEARELTELAAICRRVPKYPAQSFREAVQSVWTVFCLVFDGPGRMDKYLEPYYTRDIESRLITKSEVTELLQRFFIGVFSVCQASEVRSGNNHLVLGGRIKDSTVFDGELTFLIPECIIDLNLWRPQMSYRVCGDTKPESLRHMLELHLKRPELIMFLGDDAIISGLCGAGVPYEDACEYSVSGCSELMISGMSQLGALTGHINVLLPVLRALGDFDGGNFKDFLALCREYSRRDMDFIARLSWEIERKRYTDLYYSLFTEGTIENGQPVENGGALYNAETWCLTGIVNAVDSLAVIRDIVFDKGICDIKTLADAVKNNWEGCETLRAVILKEGRFFGSDIKETDSLLNTVAGWYKEKSEKYTPYRGGKFLFGTLTGYEISHIVFGGNTGASPDGRFQGDPFAPSIAPGIYKTTAGLTAFLNSAATPDTSVLTSSVVVNLTADRTMVNSDEKKRVFAAMLAAYFRKGGYQLQINYVSAQQLKAALENPAEYSGLRVRVTGFSGFYTMMDKELQREILLREQQRE